MQRFALVAVLLLLTPLAAGTPNNDAGSGRDAGDTPASAVTVTPGAYTGAIYHESGVYDWDDTYRVVLEQAEALRVVVTPLDGWQVLREPMGYERISPSVYPGSTLTWYIPRASDGSAYFKLGGRGNYSFEVAAIAAPDMVATSLEFQEVPVRTVVASTPVSLRREIFANVTNVGPGVASSVTVTIEALHGSDIRQISQVTISSVDPGQTIPIRSTWDQTGEFGDGSLRMRVATLLDSHRSNDVLEIEAFVLVAGMGITFDALNREQVVHCCPVLLSLGNDVHVGTYHKSGRMGVFAGMWTNNFFTGYSPSNWGRVELGPGGSPSVATCNRSTFEACPDPRD